MGIKIDRSRKGTLITKDEFRTLSKAEIIAELEYWDSLMWYLKDYKSYRKTGENQFIKTDYSGIPKEELIKKIMPLKLTKKD